MNQSERDLLSGPVFVYLRLPMRIAIIDLGTNTFNLLIADLRGNSKFKPVFKTKVAVKLGKGGIKIGRAHV